MTSIAERRRSAPSDVRSDEGPSLAALWVGLVEAWLERRRQRRALLELNEHLLKDIGVSRTDARREAAKPFWRT